MNITKRKTDLKTVVLEMILMISRKARRMQSSAILMMVLKIQKLLLLPLLSQFL